MFKQILDLYSTILQSLPLTTQTSKKMVNQASVCVKPQRQKAITNKTTIILCYGQRVSSLRFALYWPIFGYIKTSNRDTQSKHGSRSTGTHIDTHKPGNINAKTYPENNLETRGG